MVDDQTIIESLDEVFRAHADPVVAAAQAKYMKNKFPFFGIPKPLRARLQKPIFRMHSLKDESTVLKVLRLLWEKDQREFHYCAYELGEKYLKLCSPKALPCFEWMVRHKSWWDSVDQVTCHLVGPLLLRYPELMSAMDEWINDPHLWIRRAAIIFQLKYKEKTDETRLFRSCEVCIGEKDFFIRKAIGWALREYSKTSPDKVRSFIDSHRSDLSPLSLREGERLLKIGLVT